MDPTEPTTQTAFNKEDKESQLHRKSSIKTTEKNDQDPLVAIKQMSKRALQEMLAGLKVKTAKGSTMDVHTLLMDTIQLMAAEGDSAALGVLLELFANFPASSNSHHFRGVTSQKSSCLILEACLFRTLLGDGSDREAEIKGLIDNHVDVNAQNANGHTALMEATRCGEIEAATIIYSAGADPNITDDNGYTALMFAAMNNELEVTRMLLFGDRSQHPNARQTEPIELDKVNNAGKTALALAAQEGNGKIVSILLAATADPDVSDPEGRTALMEAAEHNNPQVVTILLSGRAQYKMGFSAMAAFKDFSFMQRFDADVDRERAAPAEEKHEELLQTRQDSNGFVLVESQSSKQQLLELKGGSKDEGEWKTDLTSAAPAVQTGSERKEANKNNVDSQTPNSTTPIAASFPTDASPKFPSSNFTTLSRGGANPDLTRKNGDTALIIASKLGYFSVVEALLTKANPEITGSGHSGGTTALMEAVVNGHEQVVSALLTTAHVNPDQKDRRGQTAVHKAAFLGKATIVRMLLISDADPFATDIQGQNALMLATWNGHLEVVAILLEAGLDPDEKTYHGTTVRFPCSLFLFPC